MNYPSTTGRTALLLASFACCLAASAAEVSYQYYRFTPLKLRTDNTSNSIQVAEFNFLHLGAPVDLTGVIVTNPGGRTPAAETADKLIDGLATTKWLDFHKSSVVFDFGSAVAIDGYRFTTANDAIERDPVRWVLEGSTDGSTWTLVDHMNADFATPTTRGTVTTDIALLESPVPYVMNWTGALTADWNSVTANWNNGAAATWDNAGFDLARIGTGTPGTITLAEPVTVRSIDFAQAGNTVAGNTLTLAGVQRFTGSQPGIVSSVVAGNLGVLKAGTSTVTLSGNNTFTGPIKATGGTLVLTGTNTTSSDAQVYGGTLEVSGAGSYAGNSAVGRDGTLSFTGTASKTIASGLVVGDAFGNGTLTLADSASVTFNGTPVLGNNAAGAGRAIQTGGTAIFAQDGQYLTLGNVTNSYGSYLLSGGSLSTPTGAGFRVGWAGRGVFTQTGGTLSSGRWFALGGANGKGTATFTGGTASVNASYRIIAGDQGGSEGVVNIGTLAGGNAVVTCLRTSTADGALVVSGNATSTGVLNLNSGVLKLHARIYRANGTGFVHLNGGTLRPGQNNVELMNNSLSAALVFRGGLTVDTDGFDASMSTGLLPGVGEGVYPAGGTFTVADGGSGYHGAPLVDVLTNGSGTGARAVATVSGGVVTGVTMTSPGEGYAEGDELIFVFNSGGAVTPAPDHFHVLTAADLASHATGGLRKSGAGKLTLTGTSSYTGPTLVNAGSLAANGALGTTDLTVAAGATLTGNLNTAGPVTVHGTLAPGAAVGTATGTTSLALSGGSTYAMQVTDWAGIAGTGHDTASFASVSTTATAGQKLTVHVDGTGMTGFTESGRSFTLVTTADVPAGFTADNWQVTTTNFPGTGSWSLAPAGNDLVLTYTAAPAGFATWIGGFIGLSDSSAGGDPDFDGITNLVEYVLNGHPSTSSSAVLPDAAVVGGNFVFTYVRRAESKTDTTQVFQHGTTLGSWTDVPVPATSAGNVTVTPDTPSAGLETITVTIPATGSPLFGRLQVTQP